MIGWASNTDGGEDEEPSSLPASANDQRDTTTNSLNDVKTGKGRDDVDSSKHELNKYRIVDTGRLEDVGSVVEEVIDTGPLLQEMDGAAQQGTVDNTRFVASRKAFPPGTGANVGLLDDGAVHLLEIILDQRVVGIRLQTSETGHGNASSIPPATASKPSWALGQEENTDTQG